MMNSSYQQNLFNQTTSVLESPAIEIIQDKLYWISGSKPPTSESNAYYFCVDNDLVYDHFHKDFGPLNLAKTHKYIRELVRLLSDPQFRDYRIYHYCSNKFDKQANSCYLMGAFMVVVLKMNAETIWEEYFHPYHSQIIPFRDASYGDCTYECTIFHCLEGLEFAVKLGWYSFKDFDPKEYEYYEKVENGDLNWIIPGKFIAFMGPTDHRPGQDRLGNSPEDYLEVFRHFGVTHVIRLNEPTKYDRQKFIKNGIKHTELYFIDGSTPTDQILHEFMRISEQEKGALAVHCKAGLGRTGTLIGCYAMKHFKFPAAAFIGWIRIARPGSILGPQQYYLLEKEEQMIGHSFLNKSGTIYTKELNRQRIGEMSPEDKRKSVYGDKRQGDKLVNKKFSTPSYHATNQMNINGLPAANHGAHTTSAAMIHNQNRSSAISGLSRYGKQ